MIQVIYALLLLQALVLYETAPPTMPGFSVILAQHVALFMLIVLVVDLVNCSTLANSLRTVPSWLEGVRPVKWHDLVGGHVDILHALLLVEEDLLRARRHALIHHVIIKAAVLVVDLPRLGHAAHLRLLLVLLSFLVRWSTFNHILYFYYLINN